MNKLSIVRSMSTREADHNRGRYYMHTGYVPNPNIEHPELRLGRRHELADQRPDLEIPPFVSVGGGSVGPGFLGMTWSPFVVDSNGQVRNSKWACRRSTASTSACRSSTSLEKSFISQNRGAAAEDHVKVLDKTVDLMTSKQMDAFKVDEGAEGSAGPLRQRRLRPRLLDGPPAGRSGRAVRRSRSRRLGQPHQHLQHPAEPEAAGAGQGDERLGRRLEQRGLLQDTAIIWMGEFSRTPRINGNGGRDHWARSWSVVVGGAGMKGGIAVGKTNEDGTAVETEPYTSQDVMATVCKALGISLETTFTSKNGRPMKIANSGKVIKELFA